LDKNNFAIGVFDSGMGGLTVLKALQHELPNESFIYLGDTARLPYGTKSRVTVKKYAIQMARILVEKQIKALVIACNTASTAAISYLQQTLADIPVIGVVEPGAQAAISASKTKRIAIFATQTTIASRAYHDTIGQKTNGAHVSGHACSLLVALAEEGMIDNLIARQVIQHYLSYLSNEDCIVLGCTHFPVFNPLLKALLPKKVKVVDSAKATAAMLKKLLQEQALFTRKPSSSTQFLVTDSVDRFQRLSPIFLGNEIAISDIDLIDVAHHS
jgi:glutamate racemase